MSNWFKRLIRRKIRTTKEESNDGGWVTTKEIDWYSDGSQEVHEHQIDTNCPVCCRYEYYEIDADGKKKMIYSSTGL
jgi:hypothetical protein